MSYRPMLVGRAQHQFADLLDDQIAYDALIDAIIRLVREPWDAWPVFPDDDEAYRETQFGEHGLLSFRVDDQAEILMIFNILWVG